MDQEETCQDLSVSPPRLSGFLGETLRQHINTLKQAATYRLKKKLLIVPYKALMSLCEAKRIKLVARVFTVKKHSKPGEKPGRHYYIFRPVNSFKN